jgi:hypothetical protein
MVASGASSLWSAVVAQGELAPLDLHEACLFAFDL